MAALDALDPELTRLLHLGGPAGRPRRGLARALDERVEAADRDRSGGDPLRELDIAAVYAAILAELAGGPVAPRTRARVLRIHQVAWFAGVRPRPGAHAVLAACRARGLRTGLASNAPYPAPILRAQLRHLGFWPLLDATVFSSGVGWRKPHPLLFATLVRRLRVPAAAILLVGDDPEADLAGARAFGMRARRAPRGGPPSWVGLLDAVDRLRRSG